uniref:GGDEF domain-containing protein n=1 Tax=Treponema sp. TaxID=166 RepID=UPI00388D9A8B
HNAGDTVLIALADILKSCCKEGDYACRYGGEEFALILSEKTLVESETILGSVLSCFSKLHFSFTKKSMTFSCGIAKLSKDDTKDTVFKRADQHLYASKNNGKNQITLDGEL